MSFRQGQVLTASDMNAIISQLQSRISGGKNISVRTFNGQIIIDKKPAPRKLRPYFLMCLAEIAPYYYETWGYTGSVNWAADLAEWNSIYNGYVPFRTLVHVCDFTNAPASPYEESIAPYGYPNGMTYTEGFEYSPSTATPYIDAFNEGYVNKGYYRPEKMIILHSEIIGYTAGGTGASLFLDWLTENNIDYDVLLTGVGDRWLEAINDILIDWTFD